jgi:D-alanyl-lipoteichoic acid acyltransferase DltB (MBOAT superfamily)
VDTYKGRVQELPFWDHVFFISFFPQLIAGPIVRQDDLLPQLRSKSEWRLRADQLAVGIALFSLGLFKKAFLIDPITPRIDFLYQAADIGASIGFLDAWMAAFGYGFQIYFDFSAYSDMAIGLGFMFGFRLPVNFYSPYKAQSIREFWRRWHITLSRFLRDYLFIPLGGSRHGITRTIAALLVTMSLGGLWHGASWTFVAWGLLHGLYLSVNHLWRAFVAIFLPGWRDRIRSAGILAWPLRFVSIAITFVAVNFAWILFRASDFDSAYQLIAAMLGRTSWREYPSMTDNIASVIPLYLFICWILPNTMQIFARAGAALPLEEHAGEKDGAPKASRLQFSFATGWAGTTAIVFVLAWFAISSLSPFIYFVF